MTHRPKRCTQENCECIARSGDPEPGEPYSAWCFGFRTGTIRGKEQAIENEPTDCIVECTLIGSHSESHGQHTFVSNVGDQSLMLFARTRMLYNLGLLKHAWQTACLRLSDEEIHEIHGALELHIQQQLHPYNNTINPGTKFIEYSCSCGETFFRVYKRDCDTDYYKPNKRELHFFQLHKNLGHTLYYKKARFRAKPKNGKYWQTWEGEYKFKYMEE